MPPSSGFSNRRRAAIRPGTGPDPPGGSTTRSRRAGSAPACGSWGGPRAPGPRPAPPPGGRPRPTPAPRRISRDTVCRHRPIRRAMRAAQVPLRQARGDHGPLTGPQAQAPTGAPAAPARRVPGDPMAARRPRADLGARPHRHAPTRRRQRGGRRYSYAYRATTCPRPGSTRPRPGRPRPARPQPAPGLEHSPPAPGGRQGASTHGPHRQSHARPPSPPLHRRAPTRPGPRAAAHADQPPAISSIARRRTSPGDPHPTRHIDHSSEPVMVQPPPDTTHPESHPILLLPW